MPKQEKATQNGWWVCLAWLGAVMRMLASSGSQVGGCWRLKWVPSLLKLQGGLETCGCLEVRNYRQRNTTNSSLLRTCRNENLTEIKTFKSSRLSGELYTCSPREDADPEKVWKDHGWAFKLGWLMKGTPAGSLSVKAGRGDCCFKCPDLNKRPQDIQRKNKPWLLKRTKKISENQSQQNTDLWLDKEFKTVLNMQ